MHLTINTFPMHDRLYLCMSYCIARQVIRYSHLPHLDIVTFTLDIVTFTLDIVTSLLDIVTFTLLQGLWLVYSTTIILATT